MCGRAVALASEMLVCSELAVMNSKREVLELWCIDESIYNVLSRCQNISQMIISQV